MTAFLWCVFAYMGAAVVIDLVAAHESKGMDKGDILGVLVHGALLAGFVAGPVRRPSVLPGQSVVRP